MGRATHGLGPRRQRILEPKWLRSVSPPRGGGQGAKSGRGERSQQSPTNDFLAPSVRKPFGGALCDGPCWSRAFNVETGATRGRVPPSNIEGADRTRATRLPSLLFPLLRPLLFLFRSLPWALRKTDAASFLARCQEAFVGPCSYFAPLPRCAPLSPGFPPAPARRTCVLCARAARPLLDGVPSARVRPVGWPKC